MAHALDSSKLLDRPAKRLAFVAAVLCSLLIAGCGGSGSSGGDGGPGGPPPSPQPITIQGTAQKGVFQTLDVQAIPVDSTTGVFGNASDATITGQDFSVLVDPGQLILLEATGTFTSEIDGSTIDLDRPLRLLVETGNINLNVNINFATTIAAELVLRDLLSAGLDSGALIQQQNDFTASLLGMAAGTDPAQLDFDNITDSSDMSDPNLQLLILGGGIVQLLTNDRFYAGGFGDLLDDILAAPDLAAATAVLDVLNGLSAEVIYVQAQQYSGYSLPTLVIGNTFYVWVCNPVTGCGWVQFTDAAVSVAGSTAWEAGGMARIYVRLNQVATEDVVVTVVSESDTATSGEDFIGVFRVVTVPAGETTAFSDFDLIIDALSEGEEELTVSIESRTPAYPVFQEQASVTIKDGASSSLDDQDASGMQVVSLDIAALCNPTPEMPDNSCVTLDGTESLLAVVDGRANVADTIIDLAADCADRVNCPPLATNFWRVDFFLVASDTVGTTGEVPLGPYIYAFDTVQLIGEAPLPRMPLIRLTNDASLMLARDADVNGWDLALEARIGTTNTVAATYPVPPLVEVPNAVLVGESLVHIGAVFDVMPGADYGCTVGQYAITAQYSQIGSSDFLGTPGIPATLGTGTLCVDFDPGGATAGPAVMVEGRLDVFGGSADPGAISIVGLPDGLFAVVEFFGPTGSAEQTLAGLLLLPSSPQLSVRNELHFEGWPFLFEIDALSLTPAGIELGYSNMRYVMDVGYSNQDPRSFGILYSNDIVYRGVDGQGGALILGPDGVTGAIAVQGGPGHADHTAFPRARIEWQNFIQAIDNNVLQATSITVDQYRLGQNTSCSGPDCVLGQKDWFEVAGTLALDGDGYLLGNAINSGAHNEPRWGARGNDEFAWSRPDDLTAQQDVKLAVPGYIIPDGETVSDVLLGHFDEPTAPGDVTKYPLGTDAATDGNYHPTGISLGPEVYRDGTGVPVTGVDGQDLSLLAAQLRLDNGQDPAFDLLSSPGVKYVIRNAGITGVFNVQSGTLGPNAPQFYGYSLDLERFAVRTTDNVLDTYNWVDGRLALMGEAGGPGGLDIFFTNLEIDCSARLGNIDLMYEACDAQDNNGNGFVDENCNPELHAWKAETDIFAAGFTGGGPGEVCAVDAQTFGLQHQMHFAALDKPVAFDTSWNPAGNLVTQESGQLPNYRFDRSEEGQGFPIKTSVAALDSALVGSEFYGWIEFPDSQVGVPFWNSLETDMRIANNKLGDIVAEPTVVLKKGELANLTAEQRNKDLLLDGNAESESNNDKGIKAAYEWGRTGFGFRLPVYYQPWQLDRGQSDADASGRQSRFLGRQLKKDLFVLDANAGINFIEPDRTKLSFGASADFTRLEGIEFQIDISDTDSAAAVDKVLQKLGITNGPLFEPALSEILDTLNIVNRYASRGLDELMQKGLEEAVEEIGKAAAPLTPNGQDPFVTASELLAQARSAPQQAISLLTEEVRRPLNERLFAMEGQVDARLMALQALVESLPANASAAEIDAVQAGVDELTAVLDQLLNEMEAIDAQLGAAIDDGESLVIEAIDQLEALKQATHDIDTVILQAVSVVDSNCNSSNGLPVDGEGNGFINDVAIRFAAIRRVADIISNTTGWLNAAETVAQNSDVKQRLATANQRIRDATDELLEFVENADDAMQDVVNVLCDSVAINDVVALAANVTSRIRNSADALQLLVAGGISAIDDLRALHQDLSTQVLGPVRRLRAGLDGLLEESLEFDGAYLDWIISCTLYDATHPDACVRYPDVPFAVMPYGVNSIYANESGEADLSDLLFGALKSDINIALDDAEAAFIGMTSGQLPGAYLSPEQLRRMLVTEIMASAPVRQLRLAMDKHFGEIAYAMNGIVLQIVDQVNSVIEEALATVTGPINDALREATSVVRKIPLQSAGMNGFATIAGNELERAHISAGWTMRGGEDKDKTGFKAALDAESWSARHIDPDLNTPTACAVGEAESLLDVKISAYGLPINVLAADIDIDKLYLGFTLMNGQPNGPALVPVGVFGGINTTGEIGFSEAVVFDPAFAAGLGTKQTYIGASAGAIFSSLTADVAFLVGRVCPGNTVITDLDPDVEKFLPNLPASGFTGAYLRGGATIPIIPGGCALNVGVVADFGTWIFVGQPTTFGGLVGGGATGQIACIAALKGKATVGGSASTDGDIKLVGEAWGVAGIGLDCDPGTWTSVPASRNDSWCGTGDAQFDVSFDNGKWKFNPPKPSAIH